MRLGEAHAGRALGVKQKVAERNKAIAAAVRAEKSHLAGRDLAKSMAGKRRASPEEVAEISRMLNVAQHSVVPPWETPSWFKLFRYVDGDGSGLICYEEFEEMVREVLKLPERAMPEERLRALWLALDTDSSGHLRAGEFGSFMKLGECGLDVLRQRRDELRRELRAISAQLAEHGETHSDTARFHRKGPAIMARPTWFDQHGSTRPTLAWEQSITSWEEAPTSSAPISAPISAPNSNLPVFGVTDDVSLPPDSWGRQHELTALKERFAQLDRQIARLTPSDRSLFLTPEP